MSKRSNLVLNSIRMADAQLARMPSSPEVEELKRVAAAFEEEVLAWEQTPPSGEHRELMMKKALALQVAVTRLSRRK